MLWACFLNYVFIVVIFGFVIVFYIVFVTVFVIVY